ncbi:MAG: DUF4340 domain-containing protein [Desulfomonilaceae bacterium]
MKGYKLLIYLGVLVALLAYIYFVEIKHKQAESERKEKVARIVQLDKDQIDEIKISSPDGHSIAIKKSAPDTWNIVSPIGSAADLRAVRNLLTAATLAQPEKIILERDVNWKDYGLDKPDLELSLTAPSKTVTIAFGASNPSRSSYYLKVNGDPRLLLVPDTLKISLDKKVFDLRDKSVCKLTTDDIQKVKIIRDGREVELEKINGRWRITKPVNAPAKPAKIGALLRGISDLHAKEIVDSPLVENDPYKFEKSRNKIVLETKDGATTFTFGATKDKKAENGASRNFRYLSVSGRNPVYVVDDNFFTGAKLDLESLTDRSVVLIEPLIVEKILIDFMGKEWEFAKTSDNKWKMEQPEHRDKLDDWRISEIIWSLKDLTYQSMITPVPDDLAPYRLNMPQLVMSIYQKASEKPIKITMGWPRPQKPSSAENKDNSKPPGVAGAKKAEQQSRSVDMASTPETMYATVEPKIDDQSAIYVLDGGFVGKLRVDLDQLDKKE